VRIKIDHTFVRKRSDDIQDAGIVRSIIVMANNLGLEVTAEGYKAFFMPSHFRMPNLKTSEVEPNRVSTCHGTGGSSSTLSSRFGATSQNHPRINYDEPIRQKKAVGLATENTILTNYRCSEKPPTQLIPNTSGMAFGRCVFDGNSRATAPGKRRRQRLEPYETFQYVSVNFSSTLNSDSTPAA